MRNKVTSAESSRASTGICIVVAVLLLPSAVLAQGTAAQSAAVDDPDARPPVTQADLQIMKRAREILDSPLKWNRADDRKCPAGARTFSLYCALEMASVEVYGKAEHRGAALQETRFVIDEIAADRNYDHRLMRYNNDPTTTFTDIQEVFRITESLIALRLKGVSSNREAPTPQPAAAPAGLQAKPTVNKTDIEIVKRARQILDSPTKWSRQETFDCTTDAKTFGLYCALAKAAREITGAFDSNGAALREARRVIDETAPNYKSYKAKLVDFNNDPTTTFGNIQKLLQLVEKRLADASAGNK